MKAYYKQKSKEELELIVKESITWAEVMRKLGYTANRGNSYKAVKSYVESLGIDYSHFKGKAHGTTTNTKYNLNEILVKDTLYTNMTKLKEKILKAGLLEYKCSICGISEWQGKPITLQLDHINGNNRDNRIENLRILCPNCHSQTETFCRKTKSV